MSVWNQYFEYSKQQQEMRSSKTSNSSIGLPHKTSFSVLPNPIETDTSNYFIILPSCQRRATVREYRRNGIYGKKK